MAASNTVDVAVSSTASSTTLPIEPMRSFVASEGNSAISTGQRSTNFSPAVPSIPDIPDIPSPLMKPPSRQRRGSVSTVMSSNSGPMFSFSSVPTARTSFEVGGNPVTYQKSAESMFDTNKLHLGLNDVIRSQVGRQAGSFRDLQGQFAAKAHEVDQLRGEFQSMEDKQKDILFGIPWGNGSHSRTMPLHTSLYPNIPSTSAYGHPFMSGSLHSRTAGLSTHGVGNTGMEFAIRESTAQIEDLKKKLRMTTELCAKQDAYYREVVSGLENQLKESIAGRDHILTLRENEAASQLQLIHQLEAALRKQQQITTTRDEAVISLESKLCQLGEDLAAHKFILDKVKKILVDEEKRRLRSGLVTSALESNDAVGQIGDAMIEILQKCLFDDDNEKKNLKAQLERVQTDMKNTSQQSETRREELQQEYKTRIAKLEEEHRQELDASVKRAAHVRKELEMLQGETEKIKQQHQIEVTAMEDKVKSLELELNKTKTSSSETVVLLETKNKELESSVQELKTELHIQREEKEKLLMQFSQEQASVLTLHQKISQAENARQEETKKLENLTRELNSRQEKYTEEVKYLKSDIEQKETLWKEIHEEARKQREREVETALRDEKEKSNARLDGILNELTKSNYTLSTLTADLEAKKIELTKLQEEHEKLKETLDLRCKEMDLLREEKLKLASHLDGKEKELSNALGQVTELKNSLEGKGKGLLSAENLIEKLETQLRERERTIATFKEQGSNLAEIIERNSQTGDSLQREREQLIRTLEERISEVEEMKNHREILAKKLKAKDKRVKEIDEEKSTLENSLKIKQEELSALMEDRSNIMAELKLRQIEVTKLREENTSLNSLMEGKDGEREKEITKLLSRLKGSEQDLALTRKLLKTKGAMSGKAVRVAESMQKEVTAKRGELDSLQNKIHWLKENLDTATKDARYYERKSSELTVAVEELTVQRDQFDYELRKSQEESVECRKRLNHLEQALEKAALKHAESQGIIEKMEQETARLKLKHSLEIKELERNSKAGRPEAASLVELLTRLNSGFRWPPFPSQVGVSGVLIPQKTALTQAPPLQTILPPTQESPALLAEQVSGLQAGQLSQQANDGSTKKNDEVTEDLKSLLHEVRSLICSFQAHASQTVTPARTHESAPSSEGSPAERGPLDDVSRVAGEPNPDKLGHNKLPSDTVRKKERYGDNRLLARRDNHVKHLEEGRNHISVSPESVAESKFTLVSTDLNSRISSNFEPYDVYDNIHDLLPPLHSSSPKKDIDDNSSLAPEHSITRDTQPPLPLSFHSDDSDVTSLLGEDQTTSTGNTVISVPARSRSLASSASGSQLSSSKSSVVSDVAELLRKHRPISAVTVKTGNPQNDALSDRAATVCRMATAARVFSEKSREREPLNRRNSSERSEPVYRRAEMILQSLAQTGESLTKKNKEIEHLLKEQQKRIKKCRRNEDNIQALLT